MPEIQQTTVISVTPEKFTERCSDLELQELWLIMNTMHIQLRLNGIGSVQAPQMIDHRQKTDLQKCRLCGCTNDNCNDCIRRTGEPCHWVDEDLCSTCADCVSGDGSIRTDELRGMMASWVPDRHGLTKTYRLETKIGKPKDKKIEIYGWVEAIPKGDDEGMIRAVIPTSCDNIDVIGTYSNFMSAMEAVLRKNHPNRPNSFGIELKETL